MKHQVFRAVVLAGFTVAGVLGAVSAADAKGKIVGKFGHTLATSSITGEAALEFADRVNKRAKNLEIQVFGDSTLGGTQALIEGVQLGTVHMANASYGGLGAFVSEFGAMELPYIFGTDLPVDKILKVTKSALFEEWQKMLADKMGIRVAAPVWYYGHRDITVNRHAVHPADLAGIKVRVQPAPLYVATMKALGAVPTPVDWPETYNALRQGLIEGVDAATEHVVFMKFYEAAKHFLPTHHITGLNAMVVKKSWYDKLDAGDRVVFDEELEWFQKVVGSRTIGAYDSVIAKLKSLGVTVEDIDRNEFVQAVKDAKVPEQVAQSQKWRPDTLKRFHDALVQAGFNPYF